MANPTIQQVVDALGLEPHLNGGYFKETHRDSATIPHDSLPLLHRQQSSQDTDPRSCSTAIIVLLPGGKSSMSALHKVCSDEIYHYYLGSSSLTVVEFDPVTKTTRKTVMGKDILAGQKLQHTILKGTIWGTFVNSDSSDDYAVFGATVSPGFDFRDFTLVGRSEMLSAYPSDECRADIMRLTRESTDTLSTLFESLALSAEKSKEDNFMETLTNREYEWMKRNLSKFKSEFDSRAEIVSVDNIPISLFELNILMNPTDWFNDEIINSFLALLKPMYPRTFFHNTFFYSRLTRPPQRYDYGSVKRWTKRVNLFQFDNIVIPINHNNYHWSCAVVDLLGKTVSHFDSMGSPSPQVIQNCIRYISDEFKEKSVSLGISTNSDIIAGIDNWSSVKVKIPRQQDGSSCGAFTCLFARYSAARRSFNFSQADIQPFKERLAFTLISKSPHYQQ